MVRVGDLAGWPPLPEMWIAPHPRSFAQVYALLVHRLPVLLLGEDGNRHAGVENPDAEMGDCHLPVPDLAQVGFVHETEA